MTVKILRNMGSIRAKVEKGKQSMVTAVTESVIAYGNIFVREDQGTLMESALIAQQAQGRACDLGYRICPQGV